MFAEPTPSFIPEATLRCFDVLNPTWQYDYNGRCNYAPRWKPDVNHDDIEGITSLAFDVTWATGKDNRKLLKTLDQRLNHLFCVQVTAVGATQYHTALVEKKLNNAMNRIDNLSNALTDTTTRLNDLAPYSEYPYFTSNLTRNPPSSSNSNVVPTLQGPTLNAAERD
jgi:hypothetical protein